MTSWRDQFAVVAACSRCGGRVRLRGPADGSELCLDCMRRQHPQPEPQSYHRRLSELMGVAQSPLDSIKSRQARDYLHLGAEMITDGEPFRALLLGATGCGKTHALVSLAGALVERGLPAGRILCKREQDLLVPGRHDYGIKSVADEVPPHVRVVLLDEFTRGQWLGKSGDGTAAYLALLSVVEARHLSLVVTANYGSMSALADTLDPAVWSRIHAMVNGRAVDVSDRDESGLSIDQRLRGLGADLSP